MAILLKQDYDRRAANAAARHQQNSEVNTLTPEQHEALAWLCLVRHEMHCNQRAMYVTESADFPKFLGLITGGIKQALLSVNIENNLVWDVEEWPDDSSCYMLEDCPDHEANELEVCAQMELVNNDIEAFLHGIDEKHGTCYCPTGAQRL